jgi:hypothetical protein
VFSDLKTNDGFEEIIRLIEKHGMLCGSEATLRCVSGLDFRHWFAGSIELEIVVKVLSGNWRWCLTVLIITMSATVHGQSAISALAERADAIVIVEVAFVPYGNLVLVEDVLRGEASGLTSANDLLGDCLPGKAALRELAAGSATTSQTVVYSEAIARATYKAVIFLRHGEGTVNVICGDAIDTTENWESDPRHPIWRGKLDRYLGSPSQ